MRFTHVLVLMGIWGLLSSALSARYPPASLPGTELRTLHSKIVNQDFELYIKLPWNYSHTDASYPVLYTTDANRTFPVYSTLSLIYETPTFENPEIVIVGIAYRVSTERIRGLAEWAVLRNRDLRPERSIESEQAWKKRLSPITGPDFTIPQSGHAAKFLRFIREELIPFVEANYRVSKTDRGLAGYSLGGLFTLYTLFNAPESFSRYFAGSPSRIDSCIGFESVYAAAKRPLNGTLLLTANGSEKNTLEGIRALADSLRTRNYPNFTVETAAFPDETHTTGGAAAISRALRVLYYRQ